MTKKKKNRKPVIDSSSQIPVFTSEDEERDWWADHEFSDAFYDEDPLGAAEANLELHLIQAGLPAEDIERITADTLNSMRRVQEKLSREVAKLRDENRGLEDRLDKLEARLGQTP